MKIVWEHGETSLWSSIPSQWFTRIETYFSDHTEYALILDRINMKSKDERVMSLRKINFFITMYSKIHKTTYDDNKFVYHEYDEQLTYYRRKFFDPFRRGELDATFTIGSIRGKSTFPQLNFFMWFFSRGFYEYVTEHVDEISKCMTKITREHRKKKKDRENVDGGRKRIMYQVEDSDCIALKKDIYFSY